jgi:hypothetical protein
MAPKPSAIDYKLEPPIRGLFEGMFHHISLDMKGSDDNDN